MEPEILTLKEVKDLIKHTDSNRKGEIWYEERPYILYGYRINMNKYDSIRSLFSVHNE